MILRICVPSWYVTGEYVSIDLGRRGGEMIVTFLSSLSRLDGSTGVGTLRAKLVLATSNSEFMHPRAQSRLHQP
jgi:hypothetical protein